MIKLLEVLPRVDGVTCEATERLAVDAGLDHSLAKLSAMRILMTAGATQIGESECRSLDEFRRQSLFVAFTAGHRDVSAREREARVFMVR